MMFKNLTDNAKNLAANAKIEDMSKLFKNHMAGKPDVKNALSGVMVINHYFIVGFVKELALLIKERPLTVDRSHLSGYL